MTPARLLFAIAAPVLLMPACSTAEHDSVPTQPQQTVRNYRPQLIDRQCPVEIPAEARVTCQALVVPENRTKTDGRHVELPVIRIHSRNPTPKPDPVVYLHGGPGSGTLGRGLANRVTNPILDERDLILFDQRGSGFATPSLDCPEREQAFVDTLATARPYDQSIAAFDTALLSCHARLVGSGIDLDQYNTATNAADLADLRVALGLDQWNLWGVSYGTRLALEEMRSYPEGVRSVLIDSVYPTTAGAADDALKSGRSAFDALVNGCATDVVCSSAYPDLAGQFRMAIDRLNATPYPYDYTDPTGKVIPLKITGQAAIGGLFNALYDTELIPLLPLAITQLARGDYSLLATIGQQAIPFVNNISEGAYLSFECADQGHRIDQRRVESLRKNAEDGDVALLAGWNLFCDQWPVAGLPANFAEPVTSDIPTLVVAGEYDPITPPAQSKAVADALKNKVFIQLPRAGHGPVRDYPCGDKIFTRFWDDTTQVDTSCVTGITPAPFKLPDPPAPGKASR